MQLNSVDTRDTVETSIIHLQSKDSSETYGVFLNSAWTWRTGASDQFGLNRSVENNAHISITGVSCAPVSGPWSVLNKHFSMTGQHLAI